MILNNIIISFLAGLFAPIGAICILPLFPGFLAYLVSQIERNRKISTVTLGWIVFSGVVVSMLIFGFIFTKFLRESLTKAISIISPIAFGILAIISIFLITDINISQYIPTFGTPKTKSPLLKAFLFGFLFGAIVLPCNPAPLVVLFAISTTTLKVIANLINFLFFGIGMALPLLIIAYISAEKSGKFIGFLLKNKRKINAVAGLIMLGISLYYLIFVFRVFG